MFIINLTYKADLEKVDQYLKQHIAYLDEQYKEGNFLASGRKVPRTGGIILSNLTEKSELESIIQKDPFHQNQLAEYQLTEFVPSKTCKELSFLLE